MSELDFLAELAAQAEPTMTVPALRGHLGNVDYFVITLPYASLARYVEATDPNIKDPKLRENRRPAPARFREIANYILGNPDSYRFSALTCTYGKEGSAQPIRWTPSHPTGAGQNIGLLTLSQQDPLVIVDGQHRLGAILEATEKEPSLRDESVPIVLFPYLDVERAQQLFSDLNRNAKKTTKSLDILFDHRDPVNTIVQALVDQVSFLGDCVNLEAVSVPTKSRQMFTLAGIYQATEPVLKAAVREHLLPDPAGATTLEQVAQHVEWLCHFWEMLGGCFPEWGKVARGDLDIRDVRAEYLHWNSGVISAIGDFSGFVIHYDSSYDNGPDDWKDVVTSVLRSTDNEGWRREAPHWEGIATTRGRAGKHGVLPRSAVRSSLSTYLLQKARGAYEERGWHVNLDNVRRKITDLETQLSQNEDQLSKLRMES